jgi:hypothetical protein
LPDCFRTFKRVTGSAHKTASNTHCHVTGQRTPTETFGRDEFDELVDAAVVGFAVREAGAEVGFIGLAAGIFSRANVFLLGGMFLARGLASASRWRAR